MNYKPESRIYLAAGKLVGIIASCEKLVLQHGLKYLRGIPTLTVPMHISQLPSLLARKIALLPPARADFAK